MKPFLTSTTVGLTMDSDQSVRQTQNEIHVQISGGVKRKL